MQKSQSFGPVSQVCRSSILHQMTQNYTQVDPLKKRSSKVAGDHDLQIIQSMLISSDSLRKEEEIFGMQYTLTNALFDVLIYYFK